MAQERAMAPSSFKRGSKGLSCRACSSEDKERGEGQSKERSLQKRRRRGKGWSTSVNSRMKC